MKSFLLPFSWAILFLAGLLSLPAAAAVTVQTAVDPQELNVGDEANITFSVSGGDVDEFQLPAVDGLTVEGSSIASRFVMSGFSVSQTVSHSFLIVANRAGNLIIPAFDLHGSDGRTIRTQAVTLHVLSASTAPGGPASTQQNPGAAAPADATGAAPGVPPASSANASIPAGPDGRALPVFDLITPQTTTAYVGQSVPLRIESFIRLDSNAQQDSLPTLVGSDFLMNNLSLRPSTQGVNVGDMEYERDSWVTAISAPKAGDFPLQAVRDTYWQKSGPSMPNDPFGPLFGRSAELMHKEIASNKLIMHVLPLPEDGKPADFTGAIGSFQVTGAAEPASVGVGEPVTLRFVVTGTGNFDYVRSPALAADPNWKRYVASSKITYDDEAHTQGTKSFEQAVIPEKNGTLSLPAATFSYFDPDKKQYVTLPVALPPVRVTGSAPAPIAVAPAVNASPADATPPAATTGWAANRLAVGAAARDLAPPYRRPWFWIAQGTLLLVILAGLILPLLRPRRDASRTVLLQRRASRQREEETMARAADRGDAVQFFASARRALQLRLAESWDVPCEAITLPEIERRDPALAETVAPLFTEADDVIYSGAARSGLDLQEWNRRVREMLQPAHL